MRSREAFLSLSCKSQKLQLISAVSNRTGLGSPGGVGAHTIFGRIIIIPPGRLFISLHWSGFCELICDLEKTEEQQDLDIASSEENGIFSSAETGEILLLFAFASHLYSKELKVACLLLPSLFICTTTL